MKATPGEQLVSDLTPEVDRGNGVIQLFGGFAVTEAGVAGIIKSGPIEGQYQGSITIPESLPGDRDVAWAIPKDSVVDASFGLLATVGTALVIRGIGRLRRAHR